MQDKIPSVDDFYIFKVGAMWRHFKKEHFAFWMVCGYLFCEFVRPQSIFPAIDFLPWAKLFLLGSIVGVFIDPSVKRVRTSANVHICLFSICIILSVITAEYTDIARQNFIFFFSWVIIYFLIINIVNTRERFYIFVMIYVVAAAKIAIGTAKTWAFRGFSFTSWGLMGPSGYFQNSGELAVLMLMLFPLAFYMYRAFSYRAVIWEKLILMLFWVCPVLTILGASSRGAQVALVAQLILMFRSSLFRIKPLIGIVLFCIALFYLLPQEQKDRFSDAGDDQTSQQRLLYWKHGWEMMLENPIFGVGFFNFARYYENHYPYDMLYPTAQLPHNIFVQVGTDAGFIALLIFLLLINYCFVMTYKVVKTNDNELVKAISAGLGIGVLGFVIAGQFVTVTYYPFIWIHLSFIAALVNIYGNKKRNI